MAERCGPLCQHPGCWHSSARPQTTREGSSYYLKYLSRLASRRSRKTGDEKKELLHSSLTADGLPTLKVQTLDQDHVTNGLHGNPPNRGHTRAHSLPPVKTSHQQPRLDTFGQQETHKGLHFLQMHLEEDSVPFEDMSELVLSPILIWKPGKHPHTRHITHPPHTCTSVHVPLPTHTSPHPPPYSPKPISRSTSRRSPTPPDGPGRKSPLHIKRTDLTEALPPQESSLELMEKKDKVKGQHRVTTADAESFSYLGDIPSQVVADIIQQLRSESTSNIDQSYFKSSATGERGKPPPSHVPSSLSYDLSTKKLSRKQTPPTNARSPKKRVTSFSRELSKRPLDVLRRKTPDTNRLQPITEGDVRECDDSVRTLKPSPVHLTTIQPALSGFRGGHLEPLPKIDDPVNPSKHKTVIKPQSEDCLPVTSLHHIPKTITLELGLTACVSDSTRLTHNRHLSHKKSKSKGLILIPSYNSPRPFSEETNTTTPNIDQSSRGDVRRIDSQGGLQLMSTASPDFMLVGAHFAGDHLVLVDRGDKIVHQLTDTDSDANILLHALDGSVLDTTDTSNTSVVGKPQSGVRAPPSTALEETRNCVSIEREDAIAEETDSAEE